MTIAWLLVLHIENIWAAALLSPLIKCTNSPCRCKNYGANPIEVSTSSPVGRRGR